MFEGKRINYKRACEILNCSKTKFYSLLEQGHLQSFGVGMRNRFVYEEDCRRLLYEQREDQRMREI